jgi:two-component system sensor kinase FixL
VGAKPAVEKLSEAVETIALIVGDDDHHRIVDLLPSRAVEIRVMDAAQLISQVAIGGLDAAILSDDRLTDAQLAELREVLERQPSFSDLPIVLIADRTSLSKRPLLLHLGQVRLVERPIDGVLLEAALRSSLRSRANQRLGKVFSSTVEASEQQNRQVKELLEAGLADQIADLQALGERLAREVEERKRAEELLRESEELYRYTVELTQQMVWTSDANGEHTVAGGNFYTLTDTPEGTAFEKRLPEIVHPDDYQRVFDTWQQALRDGKPHHSRFRMRVADGTYRSFEARATPRFNDEGRIIRWYGFVEDVTERELANDALREAEERYRLAARATNDAIWDWNVETGQVAWSDAAAAYLGNQPLADSDLDVWEAAIHPDDRQRVLRSVQMAVEGDKNRWSSAYRIRKADGEYAYVYDRGFIIRDETGKAVRAVGAVVDLTERRRAESELRRTQAELIHVSRVSAMGAMASTLAHELNQPLTAVTSYVRGSRRLLSGSDDPGVQQVCEALEFAEAGALRAGQIVRRLREMVARGTVEVGPEDLKKLIEDASVLAFVDEHLHGVSHDIEVDSRARWVEVDRIQIQQVLINLIRNAVQAMQHADRREVTITARLNDEEMVEVSVADTGNGIPEQVRDALFSPFHSTKSEGLGIGLSISRTIVEAHHGRIWAEDGENCGAVFRFTLPRADVPVDLELLDLAEASERDSV